VARVRQNFWINTGEWELTWVEGSTAKNAQRLYHRKAQDILPAEGR
jgi:hypothetical protein